MPTVIGYPGHEMLLDGIVRADGSSVFDRSGRRYVDLESGVWCATLGHGHPRVVAVLREQAARFLHAGYCYTEPVVPAAAEEILQALGLAGGDGVFLASGSEAVEFGVRAIRHLHPTRRLLTLADSYFGAYGSAHARAESEWITYDWLGCRDCPARDDGSRDCRHWRAIPFDSLGAFVFEPGSSSGFVRFPPVDLIDAIVTRVRRAGGLVMVNEVTTGLGRTGEWFGHHHYGLKPDIAALGKSLGNGYPVSFAGFAPGVLGPLRNRPIPYAQSHQNDPLGAAVAREVVRVLADENLIARSREAADALAHGLAELQARGPGIADVRGRGLMFAVDLARAGAEAPGAPVQRELVRRGYIVARRPGSDTLRIDPPLTIDPADVRGFVRTLGEILEERAGATP